MISLSRDGEFIAMAAARLRIFRRSAARRREAVGPTRAAPRPFREAIGFIRQGGVMILTPDGPQGPREVLPIGPRADGPVWRIARCSS